MRCHNAATHAWRRVLSVPFSSVEHWERPSFPSREYDQSTASTLFLYELAIKGQLHDGYCAFTLAMICFSVFRKCKLATTGPWQEVPPIPLSDVTILPCGPKTAVEQVPLWAISNKGDVLCRLGVSTLTPAVSLIPFIFFKWIHL